MANGYVYIIRNPLYPAEYRKIGFTERHPQIRADEFSRDSGSPERFVVEYFVEVSDARRHEQEIHRRLHSRRVNKEWFSCTEEEARKVIELVVSHLNLPPEPDYTAIERERILNERRLVYEMRALAEKERVAADKRLQQIRSEWYQFDADVQHLAGWPDERGEFISKVIITIIAWGINIYNPFANEFINGLFRVVAGFYALGLLFYFPEVLEAESRWRKAPGKIAAFKSSKTFADGRPKEGD